MKFSQKRKCLGCKAEPTSTTTTCELGYSLKIETVFGGYLNRYSPLEKCYKPLNNTDYVYLLGNRHILKD